MAWGVPKYVKWGGTRRRRGRRRGVFAPGLGGRAFAPQQRRARRRVRRYAGRVPAVRNRQRYVPRIRHPNRAQRQAIRQGQGYNRRLVSQQVRSDRRQVDRHARALGDRHRRHIQRGIDQQIRKSLTRQRKIQGVPRTRLGISYLNPQRNRRAALSEERAIRATKYYAPGSPRRPAAQGTLLDYLEPKKQRRHVASAEKALRNTKFLVDQDPKSPSYRQAFKVPSENQVETEYQRLSSKSGAQRTKGFRRLERWGYEGRQAGQLRGRPLGRLATPEASLRPERQRAGRHRDLRYRDPFTKKLYRQTSRGLQEIRNPSFLKEVSKFGDRAVRLLGKQQLPNAGNTSSFSRVGGIPIASTVPQGGKLRTVQASKTFAGRALADAINIPAQAIPSAYETGRAVLDAVGGDTRRANKLIREYKRTGVLPALASGKPGEAVKRLLAHPVAGALEVRGGQVLVTRTAARGGVQAVRLGAKATGARRTERAATRVLARRRGENVRGLGHVERTRGRGAMRRPAPYSKDLLIKAAQVRRDRKTRAQAREQGRPPTILRQPDIDHAIKGRVDHAEGSSEIRRRNGRVEVEKLNRKFGPRYAAVGRLILEGEVRRGSVKEDLVRVRNSIAAEARNLEGEKFQQNQVNVKQLDAVLADKSLLRGEDKAFAQMHRFAEGMNKTEGRLVERGYLDPKQVKSKHVPWLVRHEGARAPTPQEYIPTAVGAARRGARQARKEAGGAIPRERQRVRVAERRAAVVAGEVKVREQTLREHPDYRAAAVERNRARRQVQVARREAQAADAVPVRALSAGRARRKATQAAQRVEVAERRFAVADARLIQQRENVSTRLGQQGDHVARREEAHGKAREARQSLAGAEGRAQQARAAERSARAQARGKRQSRRPWMVDREGKEIAEDRIPELAKKHGVDTDSVAWISQRGFELSERGAHFQGGGLQSRPWTGSAARTGSATRQGVVDLSRDSVLEDAFRRRSILEAVDANLRMLNSVGAVGLKLDDNGIGGYRTPKDAKRAYRELIWDTVRDDDGNPLSATERSWVPEMEVMSLGPFFKTRSELARVAKKITEATDTDEFGSRLLQDYEKGRMGSAEDAATAANIGESGGPYILVPKVALDRAQQHAKNLGAGDLAKTAQVFTHSFRQTVLLTSMRWLTGNAVEMLFRTMVMEGIGPRSVMTGRRLIHAAEKIDPERGADARGALTGGAQTSTIDRFQVHRSSDQLDMDSALRPLFRTLELARKGSANPVRLWHAYAWTIKGINRAVERTGQYGALGKTARRDWAELKGGWEHSLVMGEKAYTDLAKGLLKTDNQIRFAREVDTIIGKYDRFGPGMRYAMTTYAPFIAWYVNSLKFIFSTLPGRHPIKTSILASSYLTQAEQLREKGFDVAKPGGVPGFLQGSLQRPNGDTLRLQHYFPFSAVSEGLAPAAQLALPQIGFLDTASGHNFTGKKIMRPDGQTPSVLELAGLAGYGLVESIVPFVSLARRVQESGGTGHPFSTVVNPRTTRQDIARSNFSEGLKRTFNPFYPVKNTASGGTKGTGVTTAEEVRKQLRGSDSVPSAEEIRKMLRGG